MKFDLAAELFVLTPKAIAWAQQQESEILGAGTALSKSELALARQVGVQHPERIRIFLVPALPQPTDPLLLKAAQETGLLGPGMVGLTLGHGIYVCHGHNSARLISHECRHVYQYEQAGSIAAYIPKYLEQIASFGYTNAPYEIDARAHEKTA